MLDSGKTKEQISMSLIGQVTKEELDSMFSKLSPKKESMNIWYSTKENSELSNLATRPFKDKNGTSYYSVEHAYQSWKSGNFDEVTYKKYKSGGVKIMGNKGTNTKDNWNLNLMKSLIKMSFEQNLEATKQLLATGNAEFTHTQDTGVWKNEFPRILMEVREELMSFEDKSNTVLESKIMELLTKDFTNLSSVLSVLGVRSIALSENIPHFKLGTVENKFKARIYDILSDFRKISPNSFEGLISKEDISKLEQLKPLLDRFSKINLAISDKPSRTIDTVKEYANVNNEIRETIYSILNPYLKKVFDVQLIDSELNNVRPEMVEELTKSSDSKLDSDNKDTQEDIDHCLGK
jgi:predicted NAD-dependent protein-ADP-ribosyltransferase YbiA (DUF1768 family)